jgi:hypothetical protein
MPLAQNEPVTIGPRGVPGVDPQDREVKGRQYVQHREVATDMAYARRRDHLEQSPTRLVGRSAEQLSTLLGRSFGDASAKGAPLLDLCWVSLEGLHK